MMRPGINATTECPNYFLRVTNALYGFGQPVTLSTKSCVDGRGSPGTTEKVNVCSRAAVMTKMLLLANTSPRQRCLPIKCKSFYLLLKL